MQQRNSNGSSETDWDNIHLAVPRFLFDKLNHVIQFGSGFKIVAEGVIGEIIKMILTGFF